VVVRQVELVAKQSGSVTTVLPPEATLENEGGEPDWWSAGTWTGSAARTHFRARKFPKFLGVFDSVRFFREKLAG
jgi:hypothetical protein